MDTPVGESWQRIAGWLAGHAPVTAAAIRPPAGAEEINRTEAVVGRPLPVDLRDWWGLMDGIPGGGYRAGFPIPPSYLPLTVAEVRERFAGLSVYADADCCAPDGSHATVAGERLFGYCKATVPICWDVAGDVLVVDLRDGPLRGCVLQWWAEDGYVQTPWSGTAAMLADIAAGLADPARTEIVDGVVRWT